MRTPLRYVPGMRAAEYLAQKYPQVEPDVVHDAVDSAIDLFFHEEGRLPQFTDEEELEKFEQLCVQLF